MKKKRRKISIILFLLLVISFLFLLNDTLVSEKDKRIYNISIIARGKNSESVMTMKEGIEQAASEMNADISFVTLSEENSVEEQENLIEREIKNKADAIIIAPVDYEKMTEPIENAMKKIPIILIESTVKSERVLSSISCDNYKLGVSLGEEMVKNENTSKNVVIVKNNLECSSVKERYDGFMSVMNNTKNICSFREISSDNQSTYYSESKKILEDNDIDAIVTFDAGILEMVAEAKKDLIGINKDKKSIEIYGIGSTNKIISFLEDKIINATAMQNEFNVGYLGVKKAIDKINGKDINNGIISSTVINNQNMYSEENQRLLFPFIR